VRLTPEQRRRWRRTLAAGVPEPMLVRAERRMARWKRGRLTGWERREYRDMIALAGVRVVTEWLARSERWLLRTWLPKLVITSGPVRVSARDDARVKRARRRS